MAYNQCDTVGDADELKGIREFTGQEIWFVAGSDAVRSMSLDELDEAFALGVLDTSTVVWTEGMERWARLGTVAGLDSESARSAEAALDSGHGKDTQRMTDSALSFNEGPSCAPVARDGDATAFMRHGPSRTRWLLAATAVLGITGTLGMSFAVQTRGRSLIEGARSEGAAPQREQPPSAPAPRSPTSGEQYIKREASRLSESEPVVPNGRHAVASEASLQPVAAPAATSLQPRRIARSASAAQVNRSKTSRAFRKSKTSKRRRSSSQASDFGSSTHRQDATARSFDPLNAELPR
jgi:GYF domain 2